MLECHENFVKQTYRNRCLIAATQGVQTLTVPVEHPFGDAEAQHRPDITQIRISDHNNWRHLHQQALEAAYGDSPFYDYYIDDLKPFFEKRWEYLFDFNLAITKTLCELLDIHPHIGLTDTFVRETDNDFRTIIRPKHPLPDPDFQPQPYYQVWQQKHGFLPNLSILDLLFNMGPESIFYL